MCDLICHTYLILSSPKRKEKIVWISINSEQDFQMKMLADNFLNLSFGNMVAFVHTANAPNRIRLQVAVLVQVFTNVRSVNDNLR